MQLNFLVLDSFLLQVGRCYRNLCFQNTAHRIEERESLLFGQRANFTCTEASISRKRPRSLPKWGRTRSITPWSVTGVSYATFCSLVSLLPALVLSCLERGINYNLLPWWWFSCRKVKETTDRSICRWGFSERVKWFSFDRQMQNEVVGKVARPRRNFCLSLSS